MFKLYYDDFDNDHDDIITIKVSKNNIKYFLNDKFQN